MNKLKDKKYKSEEYSVFLQHIAQEKEENSSFAKMLFVLLSVIGVFVLLVLSLADNKALVKDFFGEDSFITQKIIEFANSQQHKPRAEFAIPFLPKRQNILLLGVDSNGSGTDPWRGTRSDTILLLNIDPKSHSVNVISIPRDSKVYLSDDHGVQKINSAHALGGIKLVKATVEETLGVKVDKYIIVSDEAVRRIVDTIGGVPVYVEKNMFYNDYSGNLHVNLQQGINVLDGQNAVGYLRFRKDGLGDIGRTQRQQWFLRAFAEKIQTPQAIAKLPEMINTVTTYVKTNMSLYELSQYAAFAKNIDLGQIEVATLPGAPNKKGYISYWILDPEKTQEVVNRLIYRDKTDVSQHKFVAGIMYSPSKEKDAMALKSSLNELGLEVNCIGRSHLPHSQFIAHSSAVSKDFFNWLKRRTPQIRENQFVYDPTKLYCVNSDFTIIISNE